MPEFYFENEFPKETKSDDLSNAQEADNDEDVFNVETNLAETVAASNDVRNVDDDEDEDVEDDVEPEVEKAIDDKDFEK